MSISNAKFFVQLKTETVEDARISAQAYRLYSLIVSKAGKNKACWYSQAAFAVYLKVTTRYIRMLIKQLVEAGYLLVKRRGFKKVNEYVPLVRVIPNQGDRNSSSGSDRNNNSYKLYSPNYNQSKRGSTPSKSRDIFKNIPGWTKINGKWVEKKS